MFFKRKSKPKFQEGWTVWRDTVNGKEKFTLRLDMVKVGEFDKKEDAVKYYNDGLQQE